MPKLYDTFTYGSKTKYGFDIQEIFRYDYLAAKKDISIKRRDTDNTYEADWFDINDYDTESNCSTVKISTDDRNFTIGEIKISNITLVLQNEERKFDIESAAESLFFGKIRHNSKIKIEGGYGKKIDGDLDFTTYPIFSGLINGRAFKKDQLTIKGNALSLMSVFKGELAGSADIILSDDVPVSTIVKEIVNRTNITNIMTYDVSLIAPDNDIVIDTVSAYDDDNLLDVLQNLAALSNSVFGVDSDERFFFKGRDATSELIYTFDENDILNFKDANDGLQRFFTVYKVGDTQSESSANLISNFGRVVLDVAGDSVSNTTTRQAITDALRDSFGDKVRQEVQIKIKFMPFIDLFDRVRINYPGDLQNEDTALIWDQGSWDEEKWSDYRGSIVYSEQIDFKVISINHDLKGWTTTLKLREV